MNELENELATLLSDAMHEIMSLRRRNEILSAKVETMDAFMLVFTTKPAFASQTIGVDVARQLEKHLEGLRREKEVAEPNAEVR